MLKTCLSYYGIDRSTSFALPLYTLEKIAFQQHPSGYKASSTPIVSMSYQDIQQLLLLQKVPNSNSLILEIFRYAAFFGIITHVIISPESIEWKYNPYHQRDLFFFKLRLELRQYTKISSL
ncbi:MAG: hypothetical protein ACRCWI_06810 [Brevinema sp.]